MATQAIFYPTMIPQSQYAQTIDFPLDDDVPYFSPQNAYWSPTIYGSHPAYPYTPLPRESPPQHNYQPSYDQYNHSVPPVTYQTSYKPVSPSIYPSLHQSQLAPVLPRHSTLSSTSYYSYPYPPNNTYPIPQLSGHALSAHAAVNSLRPSNEPLQNVNLVPRTLHAEEKSTLLANPSYLIPSPPSRPYGTPPQSYSKSEAKILGSTISPRDDVHPTSMTVPPLPSSVPVLPVAHTSTLGKCESIRCSESPVLSIRSVEAAAAEPSRTSKRKKPIAFACHYCKYRKIKCIPDLEDPTKRCNQCQRRNRQCEYPPDANPMDRKRRRARGYLA